MSWEYRAARKYHEPSGTYEFGIIEIYYGDDTGTLVRFWSDFQEPSGATSQELRSDLEYMLKAYDKPVLDYDIICHGYDVTIFELNGED